MVTFACPHCFGKCSATKRCRDVESSLRCASCRSCIYLSDLSAYAGGAYSETVTDASDSKRVQVLQIRETSATNESSVKKSKTAAAPAKKASQRKTIRQNKAAASEG